ncbi:MAG: RNA-binding S4 domain-containing protein [Flavobacteriaceae bacterium]
MRIDQYLWCVRYFKSRSLASQACRKGAVKINGVAVKPSREILPLDQIEIRKEQIWYQMKVLDIPKSRLGAKLVDMYRQDTTPQQNKEAKEMQLLDAFRPREKGFGRPTKKDRRSMEGFLDEEVD